ncbi:hypothetical protein ACHAXR_002616 [Thalassiosira sp. AJA248-18]
MEVIQPQIATTPPRTTNSIESTPLQAPPPFPVNKTKAKTRKVRGTTIGSARNSTRKASRKRIQTLIDIQLQQDHKANINGEIEQRTYQLIPQEKSYITYHIPTQKGLHWQCNILSNATQNLLPDSIFHTNIEEFANGVVHPETKETITKYNKLIKEPVLREVSLKAICIELGRLANGYEDTKGTNTFKFMSLDEIHNIPGDRTVTYARIVVDYRPQKKDPNRVRITAGGNLIDYPGELTTRTADLTTSKILWNSTISTLGARYACADAKNFYLCTPLDRYEYM